MLSLMILAALTVCAADAADRAPDAFDLNRPGWSRQPTWLANPASNSEVSGTGWTSSFDGKALRTTPPSLTFTVDQPHKGMKFSTPMKGLSLRDFPFLVLHYRARNIDTTSRDYAVYVDDGDASRQLAPVRLCDLHADDHWHTLAVDVSRLSKSNEPRLLAVQVQATEAGKALLEFRRLEFSDIWPEGATRVGPAPPPPAPDRPVPLPGLKWTAQPSWLANPATGGAHEFAPGHFPLATSQTETSPAAPASAAAFRVRQPGAGMKWSANLDAPLDISAHRYLHIRYRAINLSARGDYTVCALGTGPTGGSTSAALLWPADTRSDGRWHVAAADLAPVRAKLARVTGLACQVQAAAPDARLEIADIRLSDHLPRQQVEEFCDLAAEAKWEGFAPLPLPLQTAPLKGWLARLRLDNWPAARAATFQSIPFDLSGSPGRVAATSLCTGGQIDVNVSSDLRPSEVYLLLLARLAGPEEDVFGGGTFTRIRDVDRFRIELTYMDDEKALDECLPLNLADGEFGIRNGLQVLVVSTDPKRRLFSVRLIDRSDQTALALVAATARTGPPLHPQAADEMPALVHKPPPPPPREPGLLHVADAQAVFRDEWMEAALPLTGPPQLARLRHLPAGRDLLDKPSDLARLSLDGRAIAAEDWLAAGHEQRDGGVLRTFRIRGREGLTVGLFVRSNSPGRLAVSGRLTNAGATPCRTALTVGLGPYRLAGRREDEHYLFPKRGAAFDNRPCSYRNRYCGTFPLQFVDTFAPACGCGLFLRTAGLELEPRHYLLEKSDAGLRLAVEHAETTLAPGANRDCPEVMFELSDGHWRRGLDAYTAWRRQALPARPPKQWFREVFNFRQRFLHGLDPLYDPAAGKLNLQSAVDEAREEFGGIDYLHLFDWGYLPPYGRIYGRQGDLSPYDAIRGGLPALRRAIAAVRAQKVPVGLYIEGYLLEEKGQLGREHGKQWQLIGSDGKGRYWPGCSEMYVCAGVEPWRAVQAATYAAKVRELDVDGMYLDQFGFAGSYVDCWSDRHGHGVPSFAAACERDCTRRVREAIDKAKPDVALYTEETPADLASVFQDGSFTYAMNESRRTLTRVPLNLTRFALPHFKTIEILVCDKPTASWATGVKWVFFNGEAIWLEGPAREWFEPHTLEAIRRCHAILRRHRDAFTCSQPVPLVRTLAGGVFVNAFPADDGRKTVYTFYNSRRRTFRGDVLAVDWPEGATAHDAWNDRPARVRVGGRRATLSLEIGPHDVGCVVVNSPGRP
ncbi:MAG: hypothetical protein BWX88_03924 [Planctomycetes bacterium ADurb.Bin126]|nr:MAG: hypothetical protein BWX88_03924 [Planctomycetes bacterium ADurb.Bin126]